MQKFTVDNYLINNIVNSKRMREKINYTAHAFRKALGVTDTKLNKNIIDFFIFWKS